jgi:hypothetical protein
MKNLNGFIKIIIKNIINLKKKKNMSKENFLSRLEDEDSSAGIEGLSQNKTMYVDQFTSEVTFDNRGLAMKEVEEDGQKRGVYPRNLKETFDYFKPKVEVEFNGDGETKKELLNFKEMKDFEINNGKGNLITNSPYLSELRSKKENCENVQKQIEKNARLRDILKDSEGRGELKALLESILEELNQNK